MRYIDSIFPSKTKIMKKIILSMAAVATLALVSCGNKADKTTTDPEAVVTEEEVVITETEESTPATDAEGASIMDKIKGAVSKENVQKGIDYVKGLISTGKLAEAKSYLTQLKPYADKVGMSSALTTVESALDKAESFGGETKEAAQQAVDDAKAKAADAVENAKAKAADATQKAADDAKAKAAAALEGLGK